MSTTYRQRPTKQRPAKQPVSENIRMDSESKDLASLLARADELYTSDLDSYIVLVQEAITVAERCGNMKWLVRALLDRAQYHRSKLQTDNAKQDVVLAQAVIARLPQQESRQLWVDSNVVLGSAYFAEGSYPEALDLWSEALRLAKEWNLSCVVNIHHDVGAALMQIGDMEGGAEHMIHAVRASRGEANDVYIMGLCNLGTICYDTNDLVSAHAYLEEALSCTIPLLWLEALCLCRLADVFRKEHEYDRALPLAEKAVRLARAQGATEYIREAVVTRSRLFLALGDLPSAIEDLEEARRIAGAPADRMSACASLALIYARMASAGNDTSGGALQPEPLARAREYLAEIESIVDPVDDIEMIGILESLSEVHTIFRDHARAYNALKRSIDIKARIYPPKARNDIGSLRHLLRIEREEHEKEIQRMKAEQIERELGNATLQLLAQTELLSDLRRDLLRIARTIPPSEPGARELRERVKNLPCQSVDWEKFDRQFRAVHPDFIRTLTERAPDLSATEVRICTMLRMNLRTQDMARIFCITESGVEFHRKNIRKKLKLGREEKLPLVLGAM